MSYIYISLLFRAIVVLLSFVGPIKYNVDHTASVMYEA